MPRNPEYQRFCDAVSGKASDNLPIDQETSASTQEIGWWKQHQFRRAMRHARAGEATEAEYRLLANKGYYYPKTPWFLKPNVSAKKENPELEQQ